MVMGALGLLHTHGACKIKPMFKGFNGTKFPSRSAGRGKPASLGGLFLLSVLLVLCSTLLDNWAHWTLLLAGTQHYIDEPRTFSSTARPFQPSSFQGFSNKLSRLSLVSKALPPTGLADSFISKLTRPLSISLAPFQDSLHLGIYKTSGYYSYFSGNKLLSMEG